MELSHVKDVKDSLSAPYRISVSIPVSQMVSASFRNNKEIAVNIADSKSACDKEWFWLLFERTECPEVATLGPFTTSIKSSTRNTKRTTAMVTVTVIRQSTRMARRRHLQHPTL